MKNLIIFLFLFVNLLFIACTLDKKDCKFLSKRQGVSYFHWKRTIYLDDSLCISSESNGFYLRQKNSFIVRMDSCLSVSDTLGTFIIDEISRYNVYLKPSSFRHKSLTIQPIDFKLLAEKYSYKGIYQNIYRNENIDTLIISDSIIILKHLRVKNSYTFKNKVVIDSIFLKQYTKTVSGINLLSVKQLKDSVNFVYKVWE